MQAKLEAAKKANTPSTAVDALIASGELKADLDFECSSTWDNNDQNEIMSTLEMTCCSALGLHADGSVSVTRISATQSATLDRFASDALQKINELTESVTKILWDEILPVPKKSEPFCPGLRNGSACCPLSCGKCGGGGCSGRPGGYNKCCVGGIHAHQLSCSVQGAPCVVDE